MRVLVTGGAGFVGSWLVEELVRMGHEVYVVDNLTSGSLENLKLVEKAVRLIVADLKESGWFERARGVEVVFHLAASPRVKPLLDPQIYFSENILATFNALEFARRYGVRTFIFASSGSVYGRAKVMPTPEDEPYSPVDLYGASKASGEILCRAYAEYYGVRCLVLRYSDVVGPRSRRCPVHQLISSLLKNPSSEVVMLGDRRSSRSYLHINDVVRATILSWNYFENSGETFEVFNVGNYDVLPLEDLVKIIGEVLGVEPSVVYKPVKGIDVIHMSIDKISRRVGWRPSLNSGEAVRRAAEEIFELLNKRDPNPPADPPD